MAAGRWRREEQDKAVTSDGSLTHAERGTGHPAVRGTGRVELADPITGTVFEIKNQLLNPAKPSKASKLAC
jgi:hypothetical protein